MAERYNVPEAVHQQVHDTPRIVDKRSSRKAILDTPTDYSKTPNRLSNVRFPLGEEPWPDVDGTSKDDPFVNVKLEVVEHADPDPDQRHLLHGGPELRMNCTHCKTPLHIAAEKRARDVLEDGGFVFSEDPDHQDESIVACVCLNGHVTQLRRDMAERLIRRD